MMQEPGISRGGAAAVAPARHVRSVALNMEARDISCGFFADSMLGRLARWLRILGYDTAYERNLPDEALVKRVVGEHRWLLTRDRYLAKRKVLRDRLTLLRSDHVGEQLRQMMVEQQVKLTLDAETPCRCADCNLALEPIPHEQAAREVPPVVATEHREFARCPGCGRIYWPGTHWDRIRLQLERLRAR